MVHFKRLGELLEGRAFFPASGEKEFSSIGVSLLAGGRKKGEEGRHGR